MRQSINKTINTSKWKWTFQDSPRHDNATMSIHESESNFELGYT